MPRTLPWMTDAASAKKPSTPRSTRPTPARPRDASPGDLVNSDLDDLNPSTPASRPARPTRRADRTPSTSPPPAPPTVEYMREPDDKDKLNGLGEDDLYRMVEDEFLATAKLFTQHIHFAEYVRLKQLARSRGRDALAAIRRGTDGKTERSVEAKLKEERARLQRSRRGGDEGSDSEDYDEYLQDPQLAGLMGGIGERRAVATAASQSQGIAPVKANTRAAAGFLQSPHKEERTKDVLGTAAGSRPRQEVREEFVISDDEDGDVEEEDDDDDDETDDDDDLNMPAPPPRTRPQQHDTPMSSFSRRRSDAQTPELARKKPSHPSTSSERMPRAPVVAQSIEVDIPSTPVTKVNRISSTPLSARSPSYMDDAARQDRDSRMADFLAERKAAREKREQEEKRKAARSVEIPTFIF